MCYWGSVTGANMILEPKKLTANKQVTDITSDDEGKLHLYGKFYYRLETHYFDCEGKDCG